MSDSARASRCVCYSKTARFMYALLLALMLSGCVVPRGADDVARQAVRDDGPGNLALALRARAEPVRALPKSRYGNPESYEVFGQRYTVMDSAERYQATGTASWYGRQFHGRLTSSREPYDMYRLTAAHPTLPLPTFVQVTRTDTGESVVVKVNDRGPFVDDRLIDLSFAAAARLGMLESGTAPVRVAALSSPLAGEQASAEPAASPRQQVVQLGAFSQRPNAERLAADLHARTSLQAQVRQDASSSLFHVQVVPVTHPNGVDNTLAQLAKAGFDGSQILLREVR